MCQTTVYEVTASEHEDSGVWDLIVTIEDPSGLKDPIIDLQGLAPGSREVRAFSSLVRYLSEFQLEMFDIS